MRAEKGFYFYFCLLCLLVRYLIAKDGYMKLVFKIFLTKVAVELQVLESNSVAVALTKEVNQQLITRLVIGRSSDTGLYM